MGGKSSGGGTSGPSQEGKTAAAAAAPTGQGDAAAPTAERAKAQETQAVGDVPPKVENMTAEAAAGDPKKSRYRAKDPGSAIGGKSQGLRQSAVLTG